MIIYSLCRRNKVYTLKGTYDYLCTSRIRYEKSGGCCWSALHDTKSGGPLFGILFANTLSLIINGCNFGRGVCSSTRSTLFGYATDSACITMGAHKPWNRHDNRASSTHPNLRTLSAHHREHLTQWTRPAVQWPA